MFTGSKKVTPIDRYMNVFAQKHSITTILVHRAHTICEPEQLEENLHHLRTAPRDIGYTKRNAEQTNKRVLEMKEKETY